MIDPRIFALLVPCALVGCPSALPPPDDDDVTIPGLDDDDSSGDDDVADDDDSSDDDDSGDDDDATDPPLVWPDFPHLDMVVDLQRGTTPVWASLVSVQDDAGGPAFMALQYADTAESTDFWVASTIKIYTATAALMILAQDGLSVDTEATFFRRSDAADPWIEDITVSVREMIVDVFDHSSNSDYTLLLRLAGIDWLSTELFTEAHGFTQTALLVPYVSDRPWRYDRGEQQRIVLTDGGTVIEREHTWSGTLHDDLVGCEFRYSSRANCSPPAEMAEHLRRLMFHEWLPASEQLPVDPAQLEWMRNGDAAGPVMNTGHSPWEDGIRRVFPDATYHHKAGRVTDFSLDLHSVDDAASDTRFVAAIVTESTASTVYQDVSEELTRMLRTPRTYLHLDWLVDDVNPVDADLWVYTAVPGTLELIVKPYAEDGMTDVGWTALPGTTVHVDPGSGWHDVTSDCLEPQHDGQQHVRGRFTPDGAEPVATSDLHFVVVDVGVPCP